MSIFSINWPGNLTVTDVPRQMFLYRFPGFILLSCLFIYIIVTEIVPYNIINMQNKIVRIPIRIRMMFNKINTHLEASH